MFGGPTIAWRCVEQNKSSMVRPTNSGAPNAAPDAPDTKAAGAKAKPRRRKRKIGPERSDNEDRAEQRQRHSLPSRKKSNNDPEKADQPESWLPLQGKIVALSSALAKADQHHNVSMKAEDERRTSITNAIARTEAGKVTPWDQPPSYQDLAMLCHSAGAQVTGMVHRRVFRLIVTDGAARQNTQKIRKAQKYGVPIVSVAWLLDCRAQRKLVPFKLVKLPSTRTTSTLNDVIIDVGQEEQRIPLHHHRPAESRTVDIDLGCCCACHELGTTANCHWCADCSI